MTTTQPRPDAGASGARTSAGCGRPSSMAGLEACRAFGLLGMSHVRGSKRRAYHVLRACPCGGVGETWEPARPPTCPICGEAVQPSKGAPLDLRDALRDGLLAPLEASDGWVVERYDEAEDEYRNGRLTVRWLIAVAAAAQQAGLWRIGGDALPNAPLDGEADERQWAEDCRAERAWRSGLADCPSPYPSLTSEASR